MRREGKMSLALSLVLLNMIPVLFSIIITTVVSATISVNRIQEMLGTELKSVAYMLSVDNKVIDALVSREPDEYLNDYVDSIISGNVDIDVITVADMRGIRVYHLNRSRVGEKFVGGDDARVYEGENYRSIATGTLGLQMRYFYPVTDNEGTQVGFVMVSALMSTVSAMRNQIIYTMVGFSAIVLLMGIVLSMLISGRIKQTLLGYEPAQIARILAERDDVFESLEEGIIASDVSNNIILINRAALKLLGVSRDDAMGEKYTKFIPQSYIDRSLGVSGAVNFEIKANGCYIICQRLPILSGERCIGSLTVLRNETQLRRQAQQLTGVNHFIESLKANQHEFMNKLHVILGFLQIDAVDEAKKYIADLSGRETQISEVILRQILNRTIAALLMGKISHGHELGIDVNLALNSCLPQHSRFLPTNALTTVLGNLIENSIEAIDSQAGTGQEKDEEITIFIHEDEHCLMITIDDTGPGMGMELINRITRGRFSTKGRGRGDGMASVRGIVANREGEMTIDSKEGEGTSISIIFRKPR
ncbi:MAG: sensor histidine kinase [Clostridia bacterium]|nr:sensor histidine kinase [Clostridia bacterium]